MAESGQSGTVLPPCTQYRGLLYSTGLAAQELLACETYKKRYSSDKGSVHGLGTGCIAWAVVLLTGQVRQQRWLAVAAALGRPSAVHSKYLLLSEGLSPKQSSKAAALVSLTLLGG